MASAKRDHGQQENSNTCKVKHKAEGNILNV